MSYGFDMYFRANVSELQAYKFARELTSSLEQSDIAEQYIKNNLYYNPIHRHQLTLSRCSTEAKSTIERILITEHVYHLFNNSFVYWSKYKLLGTCFGELPKSLFDKFNTHVYFQNSCDQDYEYTDWMNVPCFERIVESCKTLNIKQVEKILGYTPELDNLEYYRRSCAYKKIFAMLDLDKWLYGHESKHFFRFAMNTITSSEMHFKLETILKIALNNTK